ncbi:hypothetical protein HYS31_00630 [Candidatus Woesearchaeota archaeon]|nr:hypothetical protein [Candidatus Woesearchaeota archaeon]
MLVGFFKFLKRGKEKAEEGGLDLPPMPPMDEGLSMDAHGIDFDKDLPDLPELQGLDKDFDNASGVSEFDIPKIDEWPQAAAEQPASELDREATNQTLPVPQTPEQNIEPQNIQKDISGLIHLSEEPKSQISVHGRNFPRAHAGKTVYVRVDDFKAALGTINMVKTDLRKWEGALAKLENVKAAKDSSFEKIRTSIGDLQKKLIFIDKTLFKGD